MNSGCRIPSAAKAHADSPFLRRHTQDPARFSRMSSVVSGVHATGEPLIRFQLPVRIYRAGGAAPGMLDVNPRDATRAKARHGYVLKA